MNLLLLRLCLGLQVERLFRHVGRFEVNQQPAQFTIDGIAVGRIEGVQTRGERARGVPAWFAHTNKRQLIRAQQFELLLFAQRRPRRPPQRFEHARPQRLVPMTSQRHQRRDQSRGIPLV